MRQVEIELTGWTVADAMAELRIWFDRNNCVPASFDIRKLASGSLYIRVEFSDDAMADAFQREFGQ